MVETLNDKKKLPFGVASSSVNTGYNAKIASEFQPGADIVDLHHDNYSSFDNEPAQGPFTEAHVGGNQHRHVSLNTGSDDATNRPEAFLIDFGTADEIRVYGPDAPGGVIDTARPRATMLRGNSAKRPVNIRNIKSTTGSAVLGNYKADHEIVQTSGRGINNRFITKSGSLAVLQTESTYVEGLVEYALPERATGSNKYIFVERFNAPGGPDVSSRGVLDIESEEKAANNALPFRNLAVKLPLREWLTRHAGPFGFSSETEHTASWYTDDVSASYHKVNRNTLCRPDPDVAHPPGSITYEETYDNWWINHPIPRTDVQYQWVTASAITTACELGGYQRSGSQGNRAGAFDDIEYNVSSSDGNDYIGITGSSKANVNIDTLLWETSGSLELWVNNGTYGYPTWRQIRTADHPLARALRRANTIAVQDEPKNIVIETDTTRRVVQPRRSNTFKSFIETPVSNRYRPIEHQLMMKGSTNSLIGTEVKHTYGNAKSTFANPDLRARIGVVKDDKQAYDRIYEFYSDPDLPEEDNPVARFLGLVYKEVVYPREENTFLGSTRGRDAYAEVAGSGSNGYDGIFGEQRTFWKDGNGLRSQNALNSQGIDSKEYWINPPDEFINGIDINFGYQISLDRGNGNKIAILSRQSSAPDNERSFYIFKENGNDFVLEQRISGSGVWTPSSVSCVLSGSYLTFGAIEISSGEYGIQVYKSGSAGWQSEAFLTGSGGYGGTPSGPGTFGYGESYEFGDGIIFVNGAESQGFWNGFQILASSSAGGWVVEYEQTTGNSGVKRIATGSIVQGSTSGDINFWVGSAGTWSLDYSLSGFQGNVDVDGDYLIAQRDLINGDKITLFKKRNDGKFYAEDGLGTVPGMELVTVGLNQNLRSSYGTVSQPYFSNGLAVFNKRDSGNIYSFRIKNEQFIFNSEINGTGTDIGGTGEATNPELNENFLLMAFLDESDPRLDLSYDTGRVQIVRRYPWGLSNGYYDSYVRRALSHNPLKTNGILSFPESSSYAEANGELITDTDASLYSGDPVPSLCYVEGTNNFISGTSSDYVERLVEAVSGRNPWYDSYEDYSEDIRRLGKDCAVLPEFRISEHIPYYVNDNNGNFLAANKKSFSVQGVTLSSSSDTHDATSYDADFVKKYLKSEKLAHLDGIRKDHKDIAKTKKITLRCKGVKKLLPYNGFYPSDRTVQLGSLLSQSVGEFISGFSGSDDNSGYSYHGLQAFLKPLASPGILYNTIKAGIAVDYPVFTASAPAVNVTGSNSVSEYILDDAPNFRLPFESLVNLTEHLPKNKEIRFVSSFNTASSAPIEFPYYFKWSGNKSPVYEMGMHNFLAEVPNFFLAGGRLNSFSSAPEFQFEEMKSNKKYYLDVVLRQNIENNRWANYAGFGSLKIDRARTLSASALVSPLFGIDTSGHENYLVTANQYGTSSVYSRFDGKAWALEQTIAGTNTGSSTTDLAILGQGIWIDPTAERPRKFARIRSQARGVTEDTAATGRLANNYIEVFGSGSTNGWVLDQTISLDAYFVNYNSFDMSGSYIAVGMHGTEGFTQIFNSSSGPGWAYQATVSKSGPEDYCTEFPFVEITGWGNFNRLSHDKLIIGSRCAGVVEIRDNNAGTWTLESALTGAAVTFGGGGADTATSNTRNMAVSGNWLAVGSYTDNEIKIYRRDSGPSWTLKQTLSIGAGESTVGNREVSFSRDQGFLVSSEMSTGFVKIWLSSSATGFIEDTTLGEITGSFDVDLESGFTSAASVEVFQDLIVVEGPAFSVVPGAGDADGALFSFISQSSTCDIDDGWSPLFEERSGEMNLRQNGRLFGMALPMTGGNIQFNNNASLYDPAYTAYTPPQFYGEAIARISYVPTTTGKKTLDEIFRAATIENILTTDDNLVAVLGGTAMQIETASLAYLNKMAVSASVSLFGKFSEPDIEFSVLDKKSADLGGISDRFKPVAGTKPQTTNKNRWTIGTKFECPVVDPSTHDAAYSASYTSHISSVESVFCNISELEVELPRSPWTNYGEAPNSKEGIFFEIRDSFAKDEYDSVTGSLLKSCGFVPAKKQVGRLPARKDIHEAVVAIPYVEQRIEGVTIEDTLDCERFFFKIDPVVYQKQKDNLDKLDVAVTADEADKEITSTTITDMIRKMRNFILPPRFDFENFDGINPFAMYIFDFKSTLEQRDLLNIWQGIMPTQAVRMEKDEIVIEHEMSEHEFFHGRELPDNVRWLVFKIKQRGKHNYYELTSDSSDDLRFKFDFQGDGQAESVPELNYNWPYDFYSLVELSKIEVEVQLADNGNTDKIEQTEQQVRTKPVVKNVRGARKKGKKR